MVFWGTGDLVWYNIFFLVFVFLRV